MEVGLQREPCRAGAAHPRVRQREHVRVCTLTGCTDLGRAVLCMEMGSMQIYLQLHCCMECPDRNSWRIQGTLKGAVKGSSKQMSKE